MRSATAVACAMSASVGWDRQEQVLRRVVALAGFERFHQLARMRREEIGRDAFEVKKRRVTLALVDVAQIAHEPRHFCGRWALVLLVRRPDTRPDIRDYGILCACSFPALLQHAYEGMQTRQ